MPLHVNNKEKPRDASRGFLSVSYSRFYSDCGFALLLDGLHPPAPGTHFHNMFHHRSIGLRRVLKARIGPFRAVIGKSPAIVAHIFVTQSG